jgi:hypothetical protein
MIPYETARLLYIIAHVLSILCAVVLLVLYVQQAHNILLQSCCGVIMLLSLITLFDTHRHANQNTRPDFRAALSAASISYFSSVLHAHLAFLMLHSCAQACGWSLFRVRKGSVLTVAYLATSYLVPAVGLVYLVVQEADPASRTAVRNGFHWAVYAPVWASRVPSWMFAAMGTFFSLYLLYRFTRLRASSLDQNLITQLSPVYLARISVTTYLYLLIAFSALYPVVSDNGGGRRSSTLTELQRPAAHNYMVALIGVLLFAMFGCGSPARKAVSQFKRWLYNIDDANDPAAAYTNNTHTGIHYGYMDNDIDGLAARGSFTVVSEEDEEHDFMDFESALLATAPEEDGQRYSYKGWSTRRSSDPASKNSNSGERMSMTSNSNLHSPLSTTNSK